MSETSILEELPRVAAIGEDAETLAELRGRSWAVASARGLEVLRYEQAIEVLEHKELEKGASFQRRLDDIGIVEGTRARDNWNRMLVTTEGEARRALRMPFAKILRGPHMKTLQESIAHIVGTVLDEIEDRDDVDLMEQLAWKIPSRVYCHLVAAPMEYAPLAARLSDSTLAPILTADPNRRDESIEAFDTTYEFVRDHLRARAKSEPGDDFASILLRQFSEGQQTEEEMIYEGIAILQASVDNTVHQIGLMLGALLEDPARWAAVAGDEALVRPGAEEAMRLHARFGTIFRFARHATTVNGLAVPAGTWVFVSLRSANRDERKFEAPDTFRFDRDIKRALQFGGSQYSCLGQVLARVEMHEVLNAFRSRFPEARLREWSCRVTNAITETSTLRASL